MKDLLSGILFLIIGITFRIYSEIYDFGTASSMGAGYYPALISSLLILLGIVLIAKNFFKK